MWNTQYTFHCSSFSSREYHCHLSKSIGPDLTDILGANNAPLFEGTIIHWPYWWAFMVLPLFLATTNDIAINILEYKSLVASTFISIGQGLWALVLNLESSIWNDKHSCELCQSIRLLKCVSFPEVRARRYTIYTAKGLVAKEDTQPGQPWAGLLQGPPLRWRPAQGPASVHIPVNSQFLWTSLGHREL